MTFTPLDNHSFRFQPPTDPRVHASLLRLGVAAGSRGYNAHSHIGLNNFRRFKAFYRGVFDSTFADRLTAPRIVPGDTFAPDLWRFALLTARADVPVNDAVPYLRALHGPEWDVLTGELYVVAFHQMVMEKMPPEYLQAARTAGVDSMLIVLEGWRRGVPVDYLATADAVA